MNRQITRNGWLEEVWQVNYTYRGFKYSIFVRGTEPEMRAYMDSEMGYCGSYSACGRNELIAIKELRHKVYIAPKLR